MTFISCKQGQIHIKSHCGWQQRGKTNKMIFFYFMATKSFAPENKDLLICQISARNAHWIVFVFVRVYLSSISFKW